MKGKGLGKDINFEILLFRNSEKIIQIKKKFQDE